ncbi:unnamed protein product [Vitrella brassicaformis CCMP3155]|uniref:Uncharacterized protein n=1 Tax=Vitrella brassicaformis (strain CCMP3155) TaxID=1169540 RepID=A0A0G4G9X3_VITBC|nr:unnamed protein product [Vitrella brassicaformis CCMP3155]|eukprot:CEM25776.1 unnamed protein product [Vitrella brassicaformis CCMP3155]
MKGGREGGRQGHCIIFVPGLPKTPTPEFEDALLGVCGRLLKHDPTLASEWVPESRPPSEEDFLDFEAEPCDYTGPPSEVGNNAVHHLVGTNCFSRDFVVKYLDMLTAIDPSILTDCNEAGVTPLQVAAWQGYEYSRSPNIHAIEHICRQVEPAHVEHDGDHGIALVWAVKTLTGREASQPSVRDEGLINEWRQAVRTLLRWGTAAAQLQHLAGQYDIEPQHLELVDREYTAVLNELLQEVMAVASGALQPNMEPAAQGIKERINLTDKTTFGKRIHMAMQHFLTSAAATKTASHCSEVMGEPPSHDEQEQEQERKRAKVSVPSRQCFVVRGVNSRRLGLHEVVHRAIVDEAAACGLKGLDQPGGDALCQFALPELGYLDKHGRFQSLQIE